MDSDDSGLCVLHRRVRRLHTLVLNAAGKSRGLSLSRRQSATMAGASTDQARVCSAAPTGLSHAARSTSVRASCDGGTTVTTLRGDAFVPKQLGWTPGLGAVRLSPAAMVRRCVRLSAAVCRRCHAVRHSRCLISGLRWISSMAFVELFHLLDPEAKLLIGRRAHGQKLKLLGQLIEARASVVGTQVADQGREHDRRV